MTTVASFTFNPFQENTYVLYDESGECVIIDPGCSHEAEEKELTGFIAENRLKPVLLLNTHCHIDHILGNRFVKDTYNVPFQMHKADLPVLRSAKDQGYIFGMDVDPSPEPDLLLEGGDTVKFGNTELKVIFIPGHSPGSIGFFQEKDRFVISGDVLFMQSIGRTDLPGGDYGTLIHSIQNELIPLGDDVKVYSGHGPETNIGFERGHNPFLTGY